jgi:hypothetical protein
VIHKLRSDNIVVVYSSSICTPKLPILTQKMYQNIQVALIAGEKYGALIHATT